MGYEANRSTKAKERSVQHSVAGSESGEEEGKWITRFAKSSTVSRRTIKVRAERQRATGKTWLV